MPSRGDEGVGSPRGDGGLGLLDREGWKRLEEYWLNQYEEDHYSSKPNGVPYSVFPTLEDAVAFAGKNGGHFDGDAGAVVLAPEPEGRASAAATGDSSAKFCPLLRRECLRDACAWYVVEGTRGECAMPYFARWFESFCAHCPQGRAGGE